MGDSMFITTEDNYAGKWKDRIEKSKWMTDEDKTLFLRFAKWAQYQKRVKVGDRRVEKYRTDLCIANNITKKGLLGMIGSKKALQEAVQAIKNANDYTHISKEDCLRTLGSAYCFQHFKNGSMARAPWEIRDMMALGASMKDKRVAKPVITRPEMRELLKFGNTLDKAIVCTLFDSGMRMGELRQLKKDDLTFTAEGVDIKVPAGKTGERRITVIEAKTYLARWLDEHPIKKSDALLWARPNGRPMDGQSFVNRIIKARDALNENRKKNGLPKFVKPINPHNFRHSRASELGGEPGMTEQILCKYFGWEIGSDMPRTYLHLTDEQVKRAILNVHGKAKDEPQKKIETHRVCRACKAENPLGLDYCGKCGQPLDSDKQITRIGELEGEIEAMKKNQTARDKEMENLARTLAALTMGQTKRGSKAAIDDKG